MVGMRRLGFLALQPFTLPVRYKDAKPSIGCKAQVSNTE